MLQTGTILGNRYEIIQLVGSGGMADVYKAKCHRLNRMVAIKVLKEEFGKDADFVKRFHVEAQAAAGLMHPNIVNIYDVGEEAGLHYIVMELAEGMTLQSYIHKKGRLTPEETVNISIQIAQGLEAAHKNNTIHRDIKPQNIIVTNEGRVKVTDFGIARASNANTITMATIGSVHYFSPEQARGGYVDARSDIYSLGITMYEMATGHVPFDGENPVTVALKHLQEDMIPPRQIVPEIPQSLENIILRCSNKKPEFRYNNVTDLIADLQNVFSQTDGNYVLNGNAGQKGVDSPTLILSGEDANKIKNMAGKYGTYVREPVKKEVEESDSEPEDTLFQDPDELNPKLEKLILGLTILVGIIVAIIFITFLAKTLGGGSKKTAQETTTASATEISTQTTSTEKEKSYVPMPDVVGKTQEEAVKILEEKNLKAEIETEESDDVEKGYVIRQSIPNGYDVEENDTVTLIVSAGKGQVKVSDVTGKTESKAKKSLVGEGFQVQTKEEYSDTVKEGSVISQSPQGGEYAEYGSTVTLIISKGEENKKVSVPSVIGRTLKEAKSILKDAGLSVGSTTKEYSDRYEKGTVISQDPSKGNSLVKGSSVNLVLSLGEEPKTYYYPGSVTVDCPVDESEDEETTGKLTLVLSQNGKTKTIYSSTVSVSEFPISVSFEGYAEGSAQVLVYWNGNEQAKSYTVTLDKVEE
jgi:serine/threonine-protein kinase